MEEVQTKLKLAILLLKKAEELCIKDKPVEGCLKLVNKIKAEHRFLEKLVTGKKALDISHAASSNLKNLKAILGAISDIGEDKVDRILQPFVFQHGEQDSVGIDPSDSITVDIVASSGHTWINVIARKPAALLANACGQGEFGSKSLLDTAYVYLMAAEQHLTDYLKPRVVFYFADGVPQELSKVLISMGVVVSGELIQEVCQVDSDSGDDGFKTKGPDCTCDDCATVDTKPSDEISKFNCPIALVRFLSSNSATLENLVNTITKLSSGYDSIQEVNLDVTTLLALVSNLSNGSCNCSFESKVLRDHATQEKNSPVLPQLRAVMDGKKLVACSTAIKAFKKIVKVIGGPNEKKRTVELLNSVTVVDDFPSLRCLALPKSSKINTRSLIIFGTGDERKALTITSNSGFIRAAQQAGVRITAFEHQARALTEDKELP